MHAAAAEGEYAKNAAAVHVRQARGIRRDQPIHGEIAQRFQRNPDQSQQRGPEDSAVGQVRISGKEALHAAFCRVMHAQAQQHVARQHHQGGSEADLHQMGDPGPVRFPVHSSHTILNLKSYHLWVSFPSWRCFIPVNVALLRLPPFSLARAKNPSQI